MLPVVMVKADRKDAVHSLESSLLPRIFSAAARACCQTDSGTSAGFMMLYGYGKRAAASDVRGAEAADSGAGVGSGTSGFASTEGSAAG